MDSSLSAAMGTATPHLPQELIDHIIDYLHDDRTTLINCSLVSRTWLPTSRLHLFAKVSLHFCPGTSTGRPHPAELCERLHRLLTTSSSLVQHIQELNICEGSLSQPILSLTTAWVATAHFLPRLLRLLTHLRRLEFSAQSPLCWATLPRGLQRALRHVLRLPSLTYVRLKAWSFASVAELADLLACCQALRGLSLSSTTVGNDDNAESDLANHSPTIGLAEVESDSSEPVPVSASKPVSAPRGPGHRLEFLTLDYVDVGYLGFWLLGPQSTLDLRTLRELRVAHFHDIAAIDRLLTLTGPALEHFHLKPGLWNVHPFNLARNPNLRSLRLTLENPRHALAWVNTLVRSLTPPPPPSSPGPADQQYPTSVLERLGIEFYTDPKLLSFAASSPESTATTSPSPSPSLSSQELDSLADPDSPYPPDIMIPSSSCPWLALDALLVHLAELPGSALRHVDIGLFAPPAHAEFARVQARLAGLGARGLVRVYQLGVRSQRSSSQLMPRVSRFEAS